MVAGRTRALVGGPPARAAAEHPVAQGGAAAYLSSCGASTAGGLVAAQVGYPPMWDISTRCSGPVASVRSSE